MSGARESEAFYKRCIGNVQAGSDRGMQDTDSSGAVARSRDAAFFISASVFRGQSIRQINIIAFAKYAWS